jgi:hypothetical protein
VPVRLTAPALAALAAVLALAGAAGAAHVVLLPAVLAGGMVILDAVSERISERAGTTEVVLAVVGLVSILVAAAARSPLLALGAVAAAGLRPLAETLREAAPEPARELVPTK